MLSFPVHDTETAPENAASLLEKAKADYGFVPNILGTMAESPALLKSYMTLSGIFDETTFDETEKQVILLSVSSVNNCTYCVAAHSTIAGMKNVPADVIQALRENIPIRNDRLEALRRLVEDITHTRGFPSDSTVKRFLESGFRPAQYMEVVLGVGLKTLSNYTNHAAHTPLDQAFLDREWPQDKAV